MLRNIVSVVLLCLLIFVVIPSIPASPDTRYLGPRILEVGADKTYRTIGSAVDDAVSGDTIRLFSGTYYENVLIKKDNITFEGMGLPKIQHKGGYNASLFDVKGDYFTIRNISFKKLGDGIAVRILSDHCVLNGLDISCDTRPTYGLVIAGSDIQIDHINLDNGNMRIDASTSMDANNRTIFNHMRNCSIYQGVIHLDGSENMLIEKTESHDGGLFRLSSCDNITIDKCLSYRNHEGFSIYDCSNITIQRSYSYDNNGTGLWVNWVRGPMNVLDSFFFGNRQDGINISYPEQLLIKDNFIHENGGFGISTFEGYQPGKDVDLGYIKGNLIKNNSLYGILIRDNIDPYQISGNDLINNFKLNKYLRTVHEEVVSNSQSTWYDPDTTTGNYWWNWTSPDNDSNNIVDRAFKIPGNNSDMDIYPSVSRFTSFGNPVIPPQMPPPASYTPPKIATRIVNGTIGEIIEVVLFANVTDLCQDRLIWIVDSSPPWLERHKRSFYGFPEGIGIFYLRVFLYDGWSVVPGTYEIHVKPVKQTMDPPEIISIFEFVKVRSGDHYQCDFTVNVTSDRITWKMDTDADFLTMIGSTIMGDPGADDIGSYSIEIIASNDHGFDRMGYTLEVYEGITIRDDTMGIQPLNENNDNYILTMIDNSNGNVTIVKIEWFVDGVFYWNETTLNISSLTGDHTVIVRVTTSDGIVYEVERGFGENADHPQEGKMFVLIVALIAVLCVLAVLFIAIFVVRKRRLRLSHGGTGSLYITSDSGRPNIRRQPRRISDIELHCTYLISDAYDRIALRKINDIWEE